VEEILEDADRDGRFYYRYLGRGAYRDTWAINEFGGEETIDSVLKTNRMHRERYFKNYDYSQTQMEALSMMLSAGSNRTMSIYGYCGTSVHVEPGTPIHHSVIRFEVYISQEELDKEQVDDVKPRNAYTPEEKLDLALTMAEGIAELHGNPGGLIVSHDLAFDQWLKSTKDGLIKLNDFNKAAVLNWNPERNEYCKIHSSQYSSYRAPEEIGGGDIDETADSVTYGKLMFNLLTGLRPYYYMPDKPSANAAAAQGVEPEVDPRYEARSFIEGRLVQMMKRCWKTDPKQRASIFEVIAFLRETQRLAASGAKAAGSVDVAS